MSDGKTSAERRIEEIKKISNEKDSPAVMPVVSEFTCVTPRPLLRRRPSGVKQTVMDAILPKGHQ
jgi:hypothetical protein